MSDLIAEVDEIGGMFEILDAYEDGQLGAHDAMTQILALYPRLDEPVDESVETI